MSQATPPLGMRSWSWKITHSLWILPAVIGAGLLTWCSFAYIGLRARNRYWLAMALAWLLYAALAVVITGGADVGQPTNGWPAAVVTVGYFGGIAHVVFTLPAWWRWRAAHQSRGELASSSTEEASTPMPMSVGQQPAAGLAPAAAALDDPHQESTVTAAHPSFPPGSEPVEPARTVVASASWLPMGTVIPGLGVVEGQPEQASGSFGTVYRIRRDFDGKPVAGKVFRVPRGAFGQIEAERSLRDEVAMLETLHHPNIVRVLNPVPLADGNSWMAISEWIDGSTLEGATLGIEPMSLGQIREVGSQLLRALVYLEECNVVHRDIKPANVMVDRSGTVKLIDFNLTRTAGHQTVMAGTTPYLPADYLADGLSVDPLVDRYGAGVLLFELVVGKHPYHEYEMSGMPILPNSVPVDARVMCPEISVELADFLNQAVQGRQVDRFPSALAMQQAWEAAMGTGVTSTTALNQER